MKARPTSKNRSLIARKYAGAARAAAMLGNLDVKHGEKKVKARSYSKRNKNKKAMNTTKSVYSKEEKKPTSIFKEEGVVRATTSPDPVVETPKAEPKARETTNQRVLRVIMAARERLRGRGMPELDQEIDALIEEIKGWPQG